MKNLDLRARVLMTALVPATIIVIILASFFVIARFGDLDNALRDQGRVQAHQIAAASEYGVFSGNRQSLQSLTDTALGEKDVAGVVIAGPGG